MKNGHNKISRHEDKLQVTHNSVVKVTIKQCHPDRHSDPIVSENRFTPLCMLESDDYKICDTLIDNAYHGTNCVQSNGEIEKSSLNRSHTDTNRDGYASQGAAPYKKDEINKENVDDPSWDKYSYALRYNKAKIYKNVMSGCKTLKKWEEQNKFKIGFIPLGDLQIPASINPVDTHENPIHLHKKLKDSGKYNFVGAPDRS